MPPLLALHAARLLREPVTSARPLHGGNLLADGDRVRALIDPACDWGHGEGDPAMLCLFGTPSQSV